MPLPLNLTVHELSAYVSTRVVLCKYWIAVPLASVFAVAAQFVPNNKFSRHFGSSSDQFVWTFSDIFAGGSDLLSAYLTSAWGLYLFIYVFIFLFLFYQMHCLYGARDEAQSLPKNDEWNPVHGALFWPKKWTPGSFPAAEHAGCWLTETSQKRHENLTVSAACWRVCSCARNDVRYSNREHPELYGRGTTSALN